jgi:purine-binding chemotaxis protein CheW
MSDDGVMATDLMPKDPQELDLLHSRAQKLAVSLTTRQKAEKSRYYLQFKLANDTLYGIEQSMLDEVIYPKNLTDLPWLPAFISGVVSWKGMILTVLDGNYLCTAQTTRINELTRIIVLRYQEQFMGLLVNELCNFISYRPSQLKTSLQSPLSFNKDYFLGLLDYAVVFLNVETIFNDPNLKINRNYSASPFEKGD